MSGFNFGQISNVVSQFMDTDFIDIKRDINGTLQEIYSNIPAHISYSSTDNPDPTSVDIKPIIQSLIVNIQNWVDVENDDFIVAKKIDSNGNLVATYSGRCGNPVVSQGRKKIPMIMNATESETPTPIPPKDFSTIKISYYYNDEKIQDNSEQKVELNTSFTLSAPIIEGYTAINCFIDNISQETITAYLSEVIEKEYEIKFIYVINEQPEYFRFLIDGLYIKDDGSLTNGYHLYKKVNIDDIEKIDDFYIITCDDVKFIHEDNSKKINIKVGTKIVLIPGNIFVNVDEILVVENNKISFKAVEFTPSETQKNAYISGWYD